MKYETGNRAIMISMKRAFKGCPKMYCWSHKSYSTKGYIHNYGFSWSRVKIQPTAKWKSFECSIHVDHNGANLTLISHS